MKSKKDIVVEVATKLFAENGFDKTSVANICETAKVSKGLVYHHFTSKDEILKEIFTQASNRMVEMNVGVEERSPREKLVHLIETICSQLEQDKVFFQLNLDIMFQPSTRKILGAEIKERATLLFKSVKNIFDELSPKDSKTLSYIFIAEIDGLSLDYLSVYKKYPLKEVKEHLINKYKNI